MSMASGSVRPIHRGRLFPSPLRVGGLPICILLPAPSAHRSARKVLAHGARSYVSARHVSISFYSAHSPSEVITKSLLRRSRPSLPSPVVLSPFPHGARSYVSARHVSVSLFACALSVRGHHKISSPPLTLPRFPPPSFSSLSTTAHVLTFPLAMFPFPFSRVRSPSEVITKSLLHRSRPLAFLPRRSSFLSPSAPLFFDICGQNAENRRNTHTRRRVCLHRFSRSEGTKCPFFGAQPEICRAGAHIAPSFP